ncbi:MAG: multiheme c-type cytochrome, partial [Acidobacteriota bacterium]
NNVYKGTPRDCVGCHRADYDRTSSPNHAAAGFPTACESCHNASGATWGTGFNHSQYFQLVGVHATQACTACHKNNVYKGTPRDCVGCHRADYDRTSSPNHAAAGFPTACESCHNAADATWGTGFNHSQYFQLVGVHATQACTTCHKNNVYKGTPRDCVGCHRADYDRTSSPNHAAAGFPTACESCHNAASSTWSASFDHNQFYPLLGRHLTAACSSCHTNNVYRGTPRECYPCHRVQYDRTSSPNHQAAGFPTACEACHRGSDTSWNQGRFDHIWFPITSGKHAGRSCSACHADPNNYKAFSCVTGCHSRGETDSEHSGVSGYRYDSAACYSCHPRGTE